MFRLAQSEVLSYQPGRRSQTTVRRHYKNWRLEQSPPLPFQCDNPKCRFHTKPLVWNGLELSLMLDHKDGVSGNNDPRNLQLLCPNCTSQLPTHGGSNKNKVKQHRGGYSIKRKGGRQENHMPVKPGRYVLKGSDITMTIDTTKTNP